MAEFRPKVEMLEVKKLIPYATNPRIHTSGQIEKIAKSIREFGFVNPIIIADTGEVVAGHGRLRAAQKLNIDKVPCIRVGHLSREQWKTFVITDNRLTELAAWDEDILGAELKELKAMGVDLTLTGLSDIEIIQMVDLNETAVLDQSKVDPELRTQPTKSGNKKVNGVKAGGDESGETIDSGQEIDLEHDPKKGFSVIAHCETYAQQLDAMNALSALGIRCSAK